MGEYDRSIATALRLIAQKGMSVTWTQHAQGELVDTDKPWKPAPFVPTEYTVSMVFLPKAGTNAQYLHPLPNSDVPAGDIVALMGAVDFTPQMEDMVNRDGELLRVGSIDALKPNDQVVLYTVGLFR